MELHGDHLDIIHDVGDVRYLYELRNMSLGQLDITRIIANRDLDGGFDEFASDRLVRVSAMQIEWSPTGGIVGPFRAGDPLEAIEGGVIGSITSEPATYSTDSAPPWLTIAAPADSPSLAGTPPVQGITNFDVVATGDRSRFVDKFPVSLETADVRLYWNSPGLDLRTLVDDRGQISVVIDTTNPAGNPIEFSVVTPSGLGVAIDSGGRFTASRRIGLSEATVRARVQRSGLSTTEEKIYALEPANFLNTRRSERTEAFDIEQAVPARHPQTVVDDAGEQVQRMFASPLTTGFDGLVDVFGRGTTILVRFKERAGSGPLVLVEGVLGLYRDFANTTSAARVVIAGASSAAGSTGAPVLASAPRPRDPLSATASWEIVGIVVTNGSALLTSNGAPIASISDSGIRTADAAGKSLGIGYDPSEAGAVAANTVDFSHVVIHDSPRTADSLRAESTALASGIWIPAPTLLSGPEWGVAPAVFAGHAAFNASAANASLDAEARPEPLDVFALVYASTLPTLPTVDGGWQDVTSELAWPTPGSRGLPTRVSRATIPAAATKVVQLGSSAFAGTTIVAVRSLGVTWSTDSLLDLRSFYANDRTLTRKLVTEGSYLADDVFTCDTPGIVDAQGNVSHTLSTTAARIRVVATVWRNGIRNALERSYDLLGLDTRALFSGAYGSKYAEWREREGGPAPEFLVDSTSGLYLARFQKLNETLSSGLQLRATPAGFTVTVRMKRTGVGAATAEYIVSNYSNDGNLFVGFIGSECFLWSSRIGQGEVRKQQNTFSSNAWAVYTFTITTTTCRLYEDGILRCQIDHASNTPEQSLGPASFFNNILKNRPIEWDVSHILLHDSALSAPEIAVLGTKFPFVWATQPDLPLAPIGKALNTYFHASVATAYSFISGPGGLETYNVVAHRDDLGVTATQTQLYFLRSVEGDRFAADYCLGKFDRIYNNVSKRVFAISGPLGDDNGGAFWVLIRPIALTDMVIEAVHAEPSQPNTRLDRVQIRRP